MSAIRIGTFNCENLFSRYRFLDKAYTGEGYVDFIKPEAGVDSIVTMGSGDTVQPTEISRRQRIHTAQVILHNAPDILAVQEIENLPTLRLFNTHFLKHYFTEAMSLEGNDQMRLIDVGLYSRARSTMDIRTHIFDECKYPDRKNTSHTFSRDCLEVDVKVGTTIVTFLVNHFKAQEFKTKRRKKPADQPSHDVLQRESQAARVVEIVEQKYADDKNALYVVLGDLNCAPDVDDLNSLFRTRALKQIKRSADRIDWTHFNSSTKTVSKLDYIFLSPALAEKNKNAKLIVERGGLDPACTQYTGQRFDGVDGPNTEASGHCGVFVDLGI